jgi:DNA polymerase elongation subunit (family B)
MYPSVCVAHNVGGETLKNITEIKNEDPLKMFHSKPQSCLSLMEQTLIQRRMTKKQKISELEKELEQLESFREKREIKEQIEILDKEQYSLKIVANSMYGAHNYIRSRFYSIRLGNAITDIARSYIYRMEKLLEGISKDIIPCEIVYGDTDSAFIKILEERLFIELYAEEKPLEYERKLLQILKLAIKILDSLNQKFPKAMDLTLEDIAYKLIFKPARKKAYSYYSLLTNELRIVGFEAIRSDWSKIAREAQRKVLEFILKEPIHFNATEAMFKDYGLNKARSYLLDLGLEILAMPVEELLPKVVILSPIKKEPRKYKTKMPQVQAFLHYAEHENINAEQAWKEYDKFPWVITAGNGIISDRARHPKYVTSIDREHYITEILRSSESFGLDISLQEIKNTYTMVPLDELWEKIRKDKDELITATTSPSKELRDWQSKIQKKYLSSKQTKISKYFSKNLDEEE